MVTCKYCNNDYEEKEFPIAVKKHNKIYRRRKCNNCYAATKKKRRHIKKDWLNEYKKKLKCNRCELDNYKVLEFHHPNGDKVINIANSISKHSIARVKKEIDKCEVLCANCHRELHFDEWKQQRVG